MPNKSPQRQSIRLKNYDYAHAGHYYVTICTHNRQCLFGTIKNGKILLNKSGKIIVDIWQSLPKHHPVELDTFQIMPNHMHSVIQIVGATRGSPAIATVRSKPQTGGSRPAPTLGTIIGLFKSECTKKIRRAMENPHINVWQRNYYEHVIRNQKSLNKIRQYISTNPSMWSHDRNNPNRLLKTP